MGYDELIKGLREAPATQLPALLLEVTALAARRRVFASDEALLHVVERQVARTSKTPAKAPKGAPRAEV